MHKWNIAQLLKNINIIRKYFIALCENDRIVKDMRSHDSRIEWLNHNKKWENLLWSVSIYQLPYWHGQSGCCGVVTFLSSYLKSNLQLSFCSSGYVNNNLHVIQCGFAIDWYFSSQYRGCQRQWYLTTMYSHKQVTHKKVGLSGGRIYLVSVIKIASLYCQFHQIDPKYGITPEFR